MSDTSPANTTRDARAALLSISFLRDRPGKSAGLVCLAAARLAAKMAENRFVHASRSLSICRGCHSVISHINAPLLRSFVAPSSIEFARHKDFASPPATSAVRRPSKLTGPPPSNSVTDTRRAPPLERVGLRHFGFVVRGTRNLLVLSRLGDSASAFALKCAAPSGVEQNSLPGFVTSKQTIINYVAPTKRTAGRLAHARSRAPSNYRLRRDARAHLPSQ